MQCPGLFPFLRIAPAGLALSFFISIFYSVSCIIHFCPRRLPIRCLFDSWREQTIHHRRPSASTISTRNSKVVHLTSPNLLTVGFYRTCWPYANVGCNAPVEIAHEFRQVLMLLVKHFAHKLLSTTVFVGFVSCLMKLKRNNTQNQL